MPSVCRVSVMSMSRWVLLSATKMRVLFSRTVCSSIVLHDRVCHGAEHKDGDERGDRGAEHKDGDERGDGGAEHKDGDERGDRGVEHKDGDERGDRGAEHKDGDERGDRGAEHKDGDERGDRGVCHARLHADNYVPTTAAQRLILAVGSSLGGVLRPQRGDLVAVSGETTAGPFLSRLHRIMQSHPDGALLLREKPLLNSSTIDLQYLSSLPAGTLGHAYYTFMSQRGFSADDRPLVRFIEDPELAYVMTRYRQSHDLLHVLLQMDTNLLGEVVVKTIEALQTSLPMCVGAAVLSPLTLKPRQRLHFYTVLMPWCWRVAASCRQPLITLHWEQLWRQPLSQLRQQLHVPSSPHLV